MGCARAICERNRHFVADGAVRTKLIVVSTPLLHLLAGIVKRQEPMGVQALRAELAIERLDERVIGRFARPREVKHDVLLVGPKIEIAGDELGPLVDTDRLRIAMLTAYPLERGDDVLAFLKAADNSSCTINTKIDKKQTSWLYAMMQKMLSDPGLSAFSVGNKYRGLRPRGVVV